ncbi:putative P-loop containing nucleoside triphosphate hydrolase, leucine-rich repeat domain superfamily [Helianthus debilis subsp. tardiflorus]
MSMCIDSKKMDSSPRPQTTLNQSAAAQSSISRVSKKLLDEICVGLACDAELIRDKLVEDQKNLAVVSIVGMGGLGKTTLAAKVFNDGYVKHHFHVRVWVTVSPTYDKRDVLIQIMESIHAQLDLEKTNDSRLRELVHKHLFGKRYLIVIDDIWDVETWDNVGLFFPRDNTGSRILLTTRLTEVAKHANSNGLIHHLGYLNKERSWELLCQKVFQGSECPEWSIKPGMQIVEKCQGLPLALVVVGGVLAKEAWSEMLWVEIAKKTSSYIVGERNGCLEALGLSYNHLPLHLRECFLYLGGFREDYKFQVKKLIWLWVAEGFIQEDGNRSLEDIAEGYLTDLIDRNLLTVARRSKSNGGVKACQMHDLVRELCLKKAKEEQFILDTERIILSSQFSNVITPPYKSVRFFVKGDIYDQEFALRSILCNSYTSYLSDGTSKYVCSFCLLRVLNLENYMLDNFPYNMKMLVHLRYLAIRKYSGGFPSSICNLLSLQTLIYVRIGSIVLPSNISDLVNLRHLLSDRWGTFHFFPTKKPMKLQTISKVELHGGVDNFQKCFPYIKQLTCTTNKRKQNDFKCLTYLENLKLTVDGKTRVTFPATLKTLTLSGCALPWSDMSIIQSLPNLQVLKLSRSAFEGSCWNTNDEHVFQQLKFLRFESLDIKQWEAYSPSFPCLRRLEIFSCGNLEEIPFEIGYIPTLELIKIKRCKYSVGESVRRIEEEQHDLGNFDLRIDIIQEI